MAKRKYGPKIYVYEMHGKRGLIRANSKSRAANHLSQLTLQPATADAVAEMMSKGINIIEVDEPEEPNEETDYE